MVGQMVYHDDDWIGGSVSWKDPKTFKGLGELSDQQILSYDQSVGDFTNLGLLKKLKKAAKKVAKTTKNAVDTVVPDVRAPDNPEYHWSTGNVSREKIWLMKQTYSYSFPDQQKKST